MTPIEEKQERAILVGVNLNNDVNFEHSMEELKALAEACFIEVVCIHCQNLSMPNTALYVGSGKVAELRESIEMYEADTVIFDNALSPIQLRNLSEELDAVILDRTSLILRIFHDRAGTAESKLQVELARCQYMLPRLVGLRSNLGRQGGASGSLSNKGAGEKKIELDRRHLEKRISELKKELSQMERSKETMRKRRNLSSLPKVALVGYTNAGKSTILNQLVSRFGQDESKTVLEKDMLFATLETKVRQITPPGQKGFLLSDTVGFIDKLPHTLIKAFQSTLQEVKEADLLLHVVDFSDPHFTEHMQVTSDTLTELSAAHIPTLFVYNKADRREGCSYPKQQDNKLYISAREPESIEALLAAIDGMLQREDVEKSFLIPFSEGQIVSYFTEKANILSTEYREDGTLVTVRGLPAILNKYTQYEV